LEAVAVVIQSSRGGQVSLMDAGDWSLLPAKNKSGLLGPDEGKPDSNGETIEKVKILSIAREGVAQAS